MPGNRELKEVSHAELVQLLHLPEKIVAKELGICVTSLKKACRQYGIYRWPHRKIKSIDKHLHKLEAALATCEKQEERAHLQEKKAALEQERRTLPYRPRSAASEQGDQEAELSEDSDISDLVSTSSTVAASPRTMGATHEGGAEGHDEVSMSHTGGLNANGIPKGRVLERKILQQKLRQNLEMRTEQKAAHGGREETEEVTHVIPMPNLLDGMQGGRRGGDESLKVELTLPGEIAEDMAKGYVSFKIVQIPGQAPELHLSARRGSPSAKLLARHYSHAEAAGSSSTSSNFNKDPMDLPTVGEEQALHAYDSLLALEHEDEGTPHEPNEDENFDGSGKDNCAADFVLDDHYETHTSRTTSAHERVSRLPLLHEYPSPSPDDAEDGREAPASPIAGFNSLAYTNMLEDYSCLVDDSSFGGKDHRAGLQDLKAEDDFGLIIGLSEIARKT
uniref:RWP-RK domain-containing protein n=1 Tax=Guillardia theta TaxID=55529 RepID=A0A7S4KZH3_GUITH|mmetsp:Transcript_34440/g.108018  ORF Transcript_34440/g.108018 Transcript_34440/m.108018 type:complete len:448 (+) Transcript_34440:131-1474(+)